MFNRSTGKSISILQEKQNAKPGMSIEIHADELSGKFLLGQRVTIRNKELGVYIGVTKGAGCITAEVSFNVDLSNSETFIIYEDKLERLSDNFLKRIKLKHKKYSKIEAIFVHYRVNE